jgi:hypothetical protein
MPATSIKEHSRPPRTTTDRWPTHCLILLALLAAAVPALAQSPAPVPTPRTGQASEEADAMESIVIVAGQLIPKLQEAIESRLIKGLENLAFWVAVVVMIFSFLRMFRENDGAGKELGWWCFRLAVIFTLFGTSSRVINAMGQIGIDVVSVTEFRKVLWDAEIDFNTNYEKFTEGFFYIKSVNTDEATAALTSDDNSLRTAIKALNPATWSLPSVFTGITVSRAILQFSQIFLALLGGLVGIALRLFAPFAVAVAIDRNLAQRISIPFAWSAAVFTMVTPLVSHVLGLAVYLAGSLAFQFITPGRGFITLSGDGNVIGDAVALTPTIYACLVLMVMMVVASLLLLASPYISYKLAFGQVFEAVSTTASGWLGALTATGFEVAGVAAGASLQRQASEARLEGQYGASVTTAKADREAADRQTRAAQLSGLFSARASQAQSSAAVVASTQLTVAGARINQQAQTAALENQRTRDIAGYQRDAARTGAEAGVRTDRQQADLDVNQTRSTQGLLNDSVPFQSGVPGSGLVRTGRRALDYGSNTIQTHDLKDNAAHEAQGVGRIAHLYSQGQTRAADQYTEEGARIAGVQADATVAAAYQSQGTALGGINQGYRLQVTGVNESANLNLEANQARFAGTLEAARQIRESNLKAVRLEQVSAIIGTLSRDIARRAEQSMTLRY